MLNSPIVELFAVIHEPVYDRCFRTGKNRVRTIQARMTEERAKRYVQRLENQGCEVNAKFTRIR